MKSKILYTFMFISIFFLCLGSVAHAFQLEVSASQTTVTVKSTVDFTCTPIGGTPPYTYSWNFDDVDSYKTTITTQNPSHIFNWVGRHYVYVSVTDNAGATERALLIVNVDLNSSTPKLNVTDPDDVGAANVLDNTGSKNCSSKLAAIISTYYDSTHGIELQFPSGTYKFDDYVALGGGANECVTGIFINKHFDNRNKVAFVASDINNRPTLRFNNDDGDEGESHFFIKIFLGSNTNTAHYLFRGLILKHALPKGSLFNYSSVQYCFEGFENAVANNSFVTIEDCNITNFTQPFYGGNSIIRRCNITGFGVYGAGVCRKEAIRHDNEGLSVRNYVANGAQDHSKLWYSSGKHHVYVINNYGDSANAQVSSNQYNITMKNSMTDGKIQGNILRNAVSTGIQIGAYDKHAVNFDVLDNRILNTGSNGILLSAGSNADVQDNFFSEIPGPCFALGDRSKCSYLDGLCDNTYQRNTAGFEAPGTDHEACQCNLDEVDECNPPKKCGITVSSNVDNNAKYLSTDPSGWYNENGYVDPGQWEYALPINCSVSIEGESQNVTLSLSATDSGSGMGSNERFPLAHGALMQFSNDSQTWSEVRPYSQSTTWTMADGEGTKTVYARFRDRHGNWSEPVSSSASAVPGARSLRLE